MFNWTADILMILAVSVLGSALVPVRHLIMQVPYGVLRNRWRAMSLLISLFIAGYLGYTIKFWHENNSWHDLIVPMVFFFGAVFVWLSTYNAQQTVMDMRRVALLEQETITDPLIGIYNRRYLDRRLEEEFSNSIRYNTPLSVLMLDIDYFKRVNDTYGHQAGDLVLHHLGKLVQAAARGTDIVARYGGEELVVIAPHTSATKAVELAERVRKYVETHPLTVIGQLRQVIKVTISIGVAELVQGDTDSRALLNKADEALYRAKQNGRNRVES